MRSTSTLAIGILVLVLSILLIPIFRPSLGVYVTIIALGTAVALQKYVASFAGFFVLRMSRLFDVGHRVRIGEIKGDVRDIGLLHFVLDEVGEGEKSGGELTGRILHIPNHVILDQPVLNFSQNFSVRGRFIVCDVAFDELRVPLPPAIPVHRAVKLLEEIFQEEDRPLVEKARRTYGRDAPNFLEEAERTPRVMVFIDANTTWLVGRFVAPIRGRNELRSRINLRFLEAVEKERSAVVG